VNHEQNVIGQNVPGQNANGIISPIYILGSLTSRDYCALINFHVVKLYENFNNLPLLNLYKQQIIYIFVHIYIS